MKPVSGKEFYMFYETLIRTKKDFVYVETKSGRKIIHNDKTISTNAFPNNPKLTGLIKSVKKDAEGKEPLFYSAPDPNDFMEINPDIQDKGIVIKVDLKAAYWNAARETFLSENTYRKGIPANNTPAEIISEIKTNRLISLGNLAAKIKTFQFERGIQISETISQPETAPLFFTCQKLTAITMHNLMNLGGFGFWVDCVFCPNSERIEEYLNDYGIEYTRESELYMFSLKERRLQIGKKVYQFSKFDNFLEIKNL